MLTHSLAQQIAAENAAVTGLGILITDRDGMVIGSSDPRRVGTFHEASVEVIERQLPASHDARQAAALQGVKPGLTLPIVVDGVAVGTVGITGAPGRVRGFGPLVRRHTEILLQHGEALRSQLLRERGVDELVRAIANFDADMVEPDILRSRARELGFTLDLPRTAILFAAVSTPRSTRHDPSVLRGELLRLIRGRFADPEDIVVATPPGRFTVLHRRSLHAGAGGETTVHDQCVEVVEACAQQYQVVLKAAIGGSGTTPGAVRQAIEDAAEALLLGGRLTPTGTVYSIATLRTHQLLTHTGQRARQRLVDDQVGALRANSDWPVLRDTIVAWCESGFNLVDAADTLHIHRNTLLYRLSKIDQRLGLDRKNYAAYITAYLGCLADQVDSGNSGTA